MSKKEASDDEELDAQLVRMREMLKLMAPGGGPAGALGGTVGAARPSSSRPDEWARELTEKPR
jgi:hypothetical protein